MGSNGPSRSKAFEILGLSIGATDEEINRSYRKLTKKYHPDVNGGDDSKMKELTEAYSVVTADPGKSDRDNPPPDPFADLDDWAVASNQEIKIPKPLNGKDVNVKIEIDSKIALFGGQKSISYSADGARRLITIKIPMGTASGKKIRVAGKGCRGTLGGKPGDLYILVEVKISKDTEEYPTTNHEVNEDISTPKIEDGKDFEIDIRIDSNLAQSGGQKAISYSINGIKKSFKIQIPKGTSNGKRIRVAGKGYPGAFGGVPGDLYINVAVELSKRGSDITVNQNIDYMQAIRGGLITINYSRDGQIIKKSIYLQAGKTSTYSLTFAGEGSKGIGGSNNGDLIVRVIAAPPVKGRDVNAYATIKASHALSLMFSGKTSVPIRDFETGAFIRNFGLLNRAHRNGTVYTFKGEGGKGANGSHDGDLNLHVHFTESAKASKFLIPGIVAALIIIGISINQSPSSSEYVPNDTTLDQKTGNSASTDTGAQESIDSSEVTSTSEDPNNIYDKNYVENDPIVDEEATGGIGDTVNGSDTEPSPGTTDAGADSGATGSVG